MKIMFPNQGTYKKTQILAKTEPMYPSEWTKAKYESFSRHSSDTPASVIAGAKKKIFVEVVAVRSIWEEQLDQKFGAKRLAGSAQYPAAFEAHLQ